MNLRNLQWVNQELKILEQDPDYSPNNLEVEQTIQTWMESSPKMYQRLKRQNLLVKMAQVLQAKMWEELDEQMPIVGYQDAREQAVANWMMLEPEQDQQELTAST